jgi:hypothetical protein
MARVPTIAEDAPQNLAATRLMVFAHQPLSG